LLAPPPPIGASTVIAASTGIHPPPAVVQLQVLPAVEARAQQDVTRQTQAVDHAPGILHAHEEHQAAGSLKTSARPEIRHARMTYLKGEC